MVSRVNNCGVPCRDACLPSRTAPRIVHASKACVGGNSPGMGHEPGACWKQYAYNSLKMAKPYQGLAVVLIGSVPLELFSGGVHGTLVQPHAENPSFPQPAYVRVTSMAASGTNVYATVQSSDFVEPEPADLVPSSVTARRQSASRAEFFLPASPFVEQPRFNSSSRVNVVVRAKMPIRSAFCLPGHRIRGQC